MGIRFPLTTVLGTNSDHFWPWALLVFVIYVLTTMREFPASPMQVAVYAGSLDSMPGTAANTQVSINFGETVEILLVRKAAL